MAPGDAVADFEPRITAFVCNWCTYTGADLAGTSRLHMASNVRIIRLPCTGRIDPLFIVKAFERGADGVIVSGCHPADCHYTVGQLPRPAALRRVPRHHAVLRRRPAGRMTFSWVSASEGAKWRDVVNEAVAKRAPSWARSTPTTASRRSAIRRRRPVRRLEARRRERRPPRRHRGAS